MGIKIIASTHFLFAIFYITQYLSVVNVFLGAGAGFSEIFNISVEFMFIFFMFLLFGIGLLRLKNWIRIMSLMVYPMISFSVFAMLWSIIIFYLIRFGMDISFLEYIPWGIWGRRSIIVLLWIGPAIFNFYYLTRPKVKEQFK